MSQIELRGVSRTFQLGGHPVQALSEVNLDIEAGEFVLVVGPSGSGKTTLMNLIAGIDVPTGGSLRVNGHEISRYGPRQLLEYRRTEVAVVFQFHHLIPNLTAWENIEMVAELVRGKGDVGAALAAVGLSQRGQHFPHQLSGGEQQRVAVARALVKDTPILVGDEPTGNLDGKTGKQILGLFSEASQRGKTIILVTHNLAYCPVATRVIQMADGRVQSDVRNQQPISVAELAS